ncbi:MAG: ATP-dependent RNA helicase [Gammaproteobacteria bacterium]|nr:MAG: ATP-dependent RNA helicase [Gammaproteobacteria bacterium]
MPSHFSELNLIEPILRAVESSGYTEPSPIQAQTIPHVLAGTDVLGQAQTGTGKTAAFALPTLQKIDTHSKHTQVLVLAPTRELANQVADSYKLYAQYLGEVRILPVYGGADYRTQLQGLKRGAHIVVGTPGRVMDHIERGSLSLNNLNTLVLDEADEMLRMGFIDDVEWILSKAPAEKQITLFSATMPRQIKAITEKYLQNEVVVKIESKTETATTIEQFHVGVEHKQKSAALRRILEIEETDASIIFVNTKAATEELAEMLNRRGYRAAALNGDLAQKQRERVIEQIKTGLIDIILATDVAARGLDVERISHVINYDLPHDSESYVHRIGRTGRAGRSGRAILIVTPRDRRAFGFVEKDTKTTIPPYDMPDLDTINARRIERFKRRILDESEHKKLGYLEELLDDMHQESDIAPLAMAAALASMVLGKTPLLLGKREAVESFDMHERQSRRNDRNDRNAKRRQSNGERGGKDRGDRLPLSEMERFRLAVGYKDKVRPGHIVGAIANEADIEGNLIGPIDIHDDFTEVMLPKGMPNDTFAALKKARVMGKPMSIERVEGAGAGRAPKRRDDGAPKRRRKGDFNDGKPRAKRVRKTERSGFSDVERKAKRR